jgi:prepilin-type N-terminal cleavage/methylation domain-containing protein
MSNRKGFTLIELLIVVVIIGILAAIAIPKFASTKEKAYIASMKSDLKNLATAQEAYFSDSLKYIPAGSAKNIPGTTTGFPSGCTVGTNCLFVPSAGVTVTITASSAADWRATATHAAAPSRTCAIFIGTTVENPATVEGEPKCS